jgi:myo-inositol-1(or 4)-monophosphatase
MIELHELELVRRLVKVAADEELLARFTRVSADIKTDGSLITEADLAMQNRLQRDLADRWPAYALLGEEMTVDEQQELLPHRAALSGAWTLWTVPATMRPASHSSAYLWR